MGMFGIPLLPVQGSWFLVASIPVILLWQVKINLRQKIGLGIMLCLSLVMAIFAIIRGAGVRLPSSNVDIVWLAFWQQQECSIAVSMISITAFRSFFVNNPVKRERKPHYTSSYWRNRLLQRKRFNSSKEPEIAITIPSATLTGMATVIRGGHPPSTVETVFEEDEVVAFSQV